ncbi:hypothetical protein J1605_018587 [Eschrichtius robustus]|uniref:Secreted protein n=1 Tax=Eschrichtius robustus TaxID=9764 RepID=A0AB34HVJ9_ESCRO|nr:hypothetical protein J1605_018587 [Eschrichtius robustus]
MRPLGFLSIAVKTLPWVADLGYGRSSDTEKLCDLRGPQPPPPATDWYCGRVREASSLFTAAPHRLHYRLSSTSCQISCSIRFSQECEPYCELRM